MISNQAREGFDHFFVQALKSSLISSPDERCELAVIGDLSEIKETKVVILTVATYLFRLMVLIYFTPDQATREHFARINKVQVSDLGEQSFYDAVSECGNICCGILNRELSTFFPHLGMSTPNIIDKNCSAFLDVLGCGHIQHFKVNVGDRAWFHAGLCICDYADLDFVADLKKIGVDTGELELF